MTFITFSLANATLYGLDVFYFALHFYLSSFQEIFLKI